MIPNYENTDDLINDFEEEQEKTKTFGITLLQDATVDTIENDTHRIGGMVDGLDALKQSIYLMLNVESDKFIIYPYTYGINTLDLIGKPSYYVAAVIPERIKESLLLDDRITDVTDFEFEINKNKIHVKFVVHSIYGNVEEETEVTY